MWTSTILGVSTIKKWNPMKVKFRASGVGNLMVGGNEITLTQLSKLTSYQERKDSASDGTVKPLTDKMKTELKALISKRDSPFEFGDTSKSWIEKEWLSINHGFEKQVVTKEILKGHLCEQDSIGLVSEVWKEKEFRVKNTDKFENDLYTGHPDVILKKKGVVEDVKTCWDIFTFREKKSVPTLYYAQGQVYMEITGYRFFRLHYCLVDTPEELLEGDISKMYMKYGRDEDNPDFLKAIEAIRKNHKFGHIEPKKRVKTFEFGYAPDYIKKLNSRVELGRKYFNTIKL